MERERIYQAVDHTLLSQTATWEEVRQICDDAVTYRAASVCIPPCYVKRAAEYLQGKMSVCTVIGFPNGYNTTAVKLYEAKEALENGADEIDMVVNLGAVREGDYGVVENEIRALKELCGSRVLKVIIETCLLTEDEKIRLCQAVTGAGADFIKTSTGFSTGGATFADVALLAEHVGPGVRVKASGGISSFSDAEKFMELGASRLGTSRIIKLAKAEGSA